MRFVSCQSFYTNTGDLYGYLFFYITVIKRGVFIEYLCVSFVIIYHLKHILHKTGTASLGFWGHAVINLVTMA